jgi:arylformamidase
VLASTPASAQRCPPAATRTKGRPVFRDLDQVDIDEGYDNDVYAFNAKNIGARRVYNNRIAQSVLGKPERVKYGEAEIERVDIYKAKQPNAPVLVFIHGGSWRGGRAEQFATYAEPFVKAGANFVVVDFTNVRETAGDITPMADRAGARWHGPIATPKLRRNHGSISSAAVRQSSGELRADHRMGEAGRPRIISAWAL